VRHAAADSWGEGVADTSIGSIAPTGHGFAIRQNLQREVGGLPHKLHTEVESLRPEMRSMHHELLVTIERRVAAAITSQTRVIVIAMLTAVVAIAALATGSG
jgi:hypothetical protein